MARKALSENEQKLVDGIPISQYYNDYLHPLNPQKFRKMVGEKPTSLCPFHDDTDPSFHDWKAKKLYRCFGCGAVGNVIKFHQQVRRQYYKEILSHEEAIKSLARLYNIELILDEKTGEIKQESAIEIAKRKLLNREYTVVNPKDLSIITISSFRHANNQVKNMKGLSAEKKVGSYHSLDVMYAAYIMSQREKGER